jgi:hypothetical protein
MNLTLQEMLNRTNQRQITFQLMLDHLKRIQNPLIIETGCARAERHGFDGDGYSTLIFDRFVRDHGGELRTVDISPESVAWGQSQCSDKAQFICEDSVSYLWKLNAELTAQDRFIDLLYLDSFDFEPGNPHPSSAHHMKELTAIISRLRPGSMIAVDDNFGTGADRTGKGMYVEQFMTAIGKPMAYEGYQLVWRF